MRTIYIVLTNTGTILSKIVKLYTKHTYTHVSISLDKNLTELYSFGRKYAYNAFAGGFVKEGIKIGTFKRFNKTTAEIYALNITEDQYQKLKTEIHIFKKYKRKYTFNTLGLFMVPINKKRKKKNAFYCAEFCKYVLKRSKVNTYNLPTIIKPEDFKALTNLQLVYRGYLSQYTMA